ncbi:hypothetical protein KJ865_11380, partial [Myxococcota bacterium]|nr:hypothetical protein [Myxococcota bacterium]
LTGSSNLMIEPREEGQSVFTVYTPSAVLSVLGTEFDVGVSDAGTVKVGVETGIVEVADQEGNKSLEVTKGKQVTIGLDGKPSAPKAYNAEKEDWNKWYEGETKVAGETADTLSQTAVTRIEELKKKVADLEAAIAKMETKTAEEAGKAETAANTGDVKAYDKEAKPLVDNLTEAEIASRRDRKLAAMMMANAYTIRRLNALVKAGVIKPKAAKIKLMNTLTLQMNPMYDDFQARRVSEYKIRRARERRWRNWYLRHHPRGRTYAVKHKVRLPKFYTKHPVKKWKPRKNFRPRYLTGVKYRHRDYKGKKRVVKANFRQNRNWYHARKSPRMADKARMKKLERIRKRNLKMRRRRVEVRHVNKKIMRHRRDPRIRGPHTPGIKRPFGPMGRVIGPMGRVIGPMGRVIGPRGRIMGMDRPIRKIRRVPRKGRRNMK